MAESSSALQAHAVQRALTAAALRTPHGNLIKLVAYLIGEFGYQLTSAQNGRVEATTLYQNLHVHFPMMSPAVQTAMISAYAKLVAAHPNDRRLRAEARALAADPHAAEAAAPPQLRYV